MTPEQKEVLKQALFYYGSVNQQIKCIEEMAELTKALAKWNTNLGASHSMQNDIREEIADVEIMLYQMRVLFDTSPPSIDNIKADKIKRLRQRIRV